MNKKINIILLAVLLALLGFISYNFLFNDQGVDQSKEHSNTSARQDQNGIRARDFNKSSDKQESSSNPEEKKVRIPEEFLGKVEVTVVDPGGRPIPNAKLFYYRGLVKNHGRGTYFSFNREPLPRWNPCCLGRLRKIRKEEDTRR